MELVGHIPGEVGRRPQAQVQAFPCLLSDGNRIEVGGTARRKQAWKAVGLPITRRPAGNRMSSFWLMTLLNLLVLVAPSLPSAAAGSGRASHSTTLTILHTNDLHGHLFAWRGWEEPFAGKTIGGADRLATAIKGVRSAVGENQVLLVDAGDTFSDAMLAAETQGRAVVQVMNALGYDAMVVGNHDPDFTMEVLHQRIQEANFAVLAANLLDARTRQPAIQAAVIHERGGVQVGIVGLAYPHTALTTQSHNVEGVQFVSAAETAREWIPQLRRQGAQVIIVLSHLGLGADVALAQAVIGIDVIVGGHSHNRLDAPLSVGRTLIVQAGAHGSDLGRLDVLVNNGQVVGSHGRLMLLDHEIYASDAELATLLNRLRAPYRTKLEAGVAKAMEDIPRAQTLAGSTPRRRDAESPVDELFADLLREALNVDLVLLPGVGYGVALAKGIVTDESLRNLLPHDSQMVSMTLSGKDLRHILEQAVQNVVADNPNERVGGMIQVSGLTFTYDPDRPPFERVQQVIVGAEPLQDDRMYMAATNSLLAEGGHRYQSFTDGRERAQRGSQYDIVRQQLQRHGTVGLPPAGRIQRGR